MTCETRNTSAARKSVESKARSAFRLICGPQLGEGLPLYAINVTPIATIRASEKTVVTNSNAKMRSTRRRDVVGVALAISEGDCGAVGRALGVCGGLPYFHCDHNEDPTIISNVRLSRRARLALAYSTWVQDAA